MAIAFDAASQGDALAATSLTVAHTVAGTDRALIVAVETWESGSTGAMPTVTYNSVSMTQVSTVVFGSGGAEERITLFQLVAPSTGANNIVVTASPTQDEIVLAAVSYTGVDQTTPLDTASTEVEASVTSTALAVSSATGDLVIDAVSWYDQTITVGAGQTQRVLNDNASTADSIAMSDEAGAASVDMSWSFGAAAYTGHIVVNMNVAASGATATPATIATTVTAPTPTITIAPTVTPPVVVATSTLPSPSIGAASVVTPTVVASITALPTPTLTNWRWDLGPGYDIGRFYRYGASQFILVSGLPRSSGTGYSTTEGWETCSGMFAIPVTKKQDAMNAVSATWVTNTGANQATLTALINAALTSAGYSKPNGAAIT